MKFTSVVKWMLLIGLGAAVVVGATGIHYWNWRHELVKAELLRRFEQIAPDLRLSLGRTQVDGTHGVTFRDVELRDRRSNQLVLRARSISLHVDSKALLDHQRLVVRKVEMDSADVLVVRQVDGRWNWQEYTWNPGESSTGSLPEVEIRQVRILLQLRHEAEIPPARLLLSSLRLQAVPASARSFDLSGSLELPGVGSLGLSGVCDLATGTWSLGGDLRDVTADHDLLRLAEETSPGIRKQLTQLEATIRNALPPPRTASREPESALVIGRDISSAPRFQGRLDVDFDVSGSSMNKVPRFRLLVEVRDGRISVPGIPVQLTDVNAAFYRDNETVRLKLREARHEGARLSGEFTMKTTEDGPPPVVTLDVKNFPVGPRLRPLFSARTRRIFNNFQPVFRLSGTGRLVRQSSGRWQLQDAKAQVQDGRLLYHRFRFPLTGITAVIRQRPLEQTHGVAILDVEATGVAGDQQWTTTGWWKNPGPETESRFAMKIEGYPLDARFRDALEPAARKVVDALDLDGIGRADFDFYRPPGLDQPTHVIIDGHVTDATMRFARFPLNISELSGHVSFDSRDGHWKFEDVQGRHGDARLSCHGDFTGLPRPGVLDLTVTAEHLSLDADLYNALSEPQRHVWVLLEPEGYCDLTTKIHWSVSPGQRAVVRFPEKSPIRIYDARIRPRPFPYEMNVEEAFVSFEPNDPRYGGVEHCAIHSLVASHEGAPISASGWAELQPGGRWQVHLNHLTARDLPPDDELRAALPDSWRDTLNRLHQRGRVSIQDSEIEFRGISGGDTSVTAAWNLQLGLQECALNAGLDVEKVNGAVTARGSWDGFHLQNEGDIRLDSAEVLEIPLTRIRGPYTIDDDELVLGSRSMLNSKETGTVDRQRRVHAQTYGGTLFLDGLISSKDRGDYILFVELENALLQAYALRHLRSAGQLEGVVSAWLALEGQGDAVADVRGRGQLEISPAKLYELPVIVELFSALASMNFNVRNRTAFDYALLTFDVRRERFEFNQIDLVGKSLALRGRGSVGFGGDVVLDFYSRPPRSGRLSIPLVDLLVNGATQWAKVQVRGTTQQPQTNVYPTAQLDDSMRQFLNSLNTAPGMIPSLSVPGVFPFPAGPVTIRPRSQQR